MSDTKNEAFSSNGGWDKLIMILSKIRTKNEMNAICNFLFTFEEKEQFGNRILLAQALIDQNSSQREIAKSIGVSISTVTRCSNALKTANTIVKEHFK